MKSVKKMIAIVLVACLLVVAGCTSTASIKSKDFITQENLAQNAKIDGELGGKEGSHFDINFSSLTTLNTVVLKENKNNITEFSIQSLNEDTQSYDTIYTQDEIGPYRYCAFEKISTKSLRIVISGAVEKFKITSVEVYNINHLIDENESDFRVTSYVVADQIYDKANLHSADFDTITDVILIGANMFDEEGNIGYNDVEINGEKIPGRELFDTAIANLKEVIGDRKVRIHVNFLGPDGEEKSDDWDKQQSIKAKAHSKAFQSSGLVKYMGQFVKDHQIDGIFFDYEYPLKKSEQNVFSSFLVELKKEIGSEKMLGAALVAWNAKLTQKAYDSLDMIELMVYDLFNERGNHADFASVVEDVTAMIKKGADPSKIDVGLPFYARPADGEAFWYDYSSEAANLGKFKNYSDAKTDVNGNELPHNEGGRYYNSYQMIYDKTAFSMNYGAGGVMVWNYSVDLPFENELSLLRSIDNSVNTRSK